MAPKTDWAGVKTPSAIIKLTPETAKVLIKLWATLLLSSQFLIIRLLDLSDSVECRSILTGRFLRLSRVAMLQYRDNNEKIAKVPPVKESAYELRNKACLD
jgi:hypothetical protein